MEYHYAGHCQCKQVYCEIKLPLNLQNFSARACDCDFCTERKINYLSASDAEIFIKSKTPLLTLQQGSKQAKFLTCSQCKTVIAAAIELNNALIGAINSTLLSNAQLLLPSTVASPKLLSSKEKFERWQNVWVPISLTTT